MGCAQGGHKRGMHPCIVCSSLLLGHWNAEGIWPLITCQGALRLCLRAWRRRKIFHHLVRLRRQPAALRPFSTWHGSYWTALLLEFLGVNAWRTRWVIQRRIEAAMAFDNVGKKSTFLAVVQCSTVAQPPTATLNHVYCDSNTIASQLGPRRLCMTRERS